MELNSWGKEENDIFKNVLMMFSPFSLTRFESIAEFVQKPVDEVKKHYDELVKDLLEAGSNEVTFPRELTNEMVQRLYQVEKTMWNREEHEWFLIGLRRFGEDWEQIANLVYSKNPMQVMVYAHNFFHWSEKNVVKQSHANDITMVALASTSQQEIPSPQQEIMAMEIGDDAKVFGAKSYLP
ncbi:unnamed protein product [Cochlearia groenlandica]